MAEVRVKIFSKDLQKNLFPDNAFYKRSKKDPASSANSIDIPQSQSQARAKIGNVQIDYDTAGNNLSDADSLTAIKRINTLLNYINQNFFVPPVIIDKNNQDGELSYEKQAQIREEFADEINTQVANYAGVKWAPTVAGNILKTTGTATRTSLVVGGYAGLVKRIVKQDLLNLAKAAKKQQKMGGKWYILPTVEQWEDIMLIPDFVDFEKTGNQTMLKNGVIGTWLGFQWLEPRQNDDLEANVIYDTVVPAAPTKVDYIGAVDADGRTIFAVTPTVTSVSALLAWNDKMVRRSEGTVKSYFTKDDPLYQADILSANVRFGASFGRSD
ncbi:hypothetical protein KAU11_05790, partial [Candidatus Babeliales bacterium]|nr:hypothetical protein [Candidatus Babeliales bacterium]